MATPEVGAAVRLRSRAVTWLTPRRVAIAAAVVIAIEIAGLVAVSVLGDLPRNAVGSPVLTDYLAHWTGGRLLLDGHADVLYDRSAQLDLQEPLWGGRSRITWFVSPPAAAVLYAPFAALPYLGSAVAWTVVSLGLLLGSMLLLRPLFPRLGTLGWGGVTLVVLATQPVLEAIGSGQDSALSLFLWVAGLRLLLARRDYAAGALLGLGLLKPQLFVLVPLVLIARRRWRALGSFAAVAAGLAAVSVAVVGPAGALAWARLPFEPTYQDGIQVDQAWRMRGMPEFLQSLLPTSWPRVGFAVGVVVAVVLVVLMLRAARRAPADAEVAVWALAALTTVLASLHLLEYDLLLAIPAFLYVVERHDSRRTRIALAVVFVWTWTTWVRRPLVEHLGYPYIVLSSAWDTLAILLLWIVVHGDLVDRASATFTASTDAPTLLGTRAGVPALGVTDEQRTHD